MLWGHLMSSTPSDSTGRASPHSSSSSHEASPSSSQSHPLLLTALSIPRETQGSILPNLICCWLVVKGDISFFNVQCLKASY